MFKLFGGEKKAKKSGYFLELQEDEDNTATVEERKEAVFGEVKATKKGKGTKNTPAPAKVETVEEPKYKAVSIAEAVSRPTIVAHKKEEGPVNFATEYSISQTMKRRAPGPSLNTFKDMARKIQK